MGLDTETVKEFDYFDGMVVPHNCYFVVRLDGNCFSRYTKDFEKPFDKKFHQAMVKTIEEVMRAVPDIYMAHTHSDEVSFYFKKDSDWFKRRVQKINSILAGMVSTNFSKLSPYGEAQFDSRILVLPTKEDVEKYDKDRRLNSFRGCVNSYAFYSLAEKTSIKEATERLKNLNSNQRQELLFQEFGVNIAKVPKWHRVGTYFECEDYEKEGYNPVTKKKTLAVRRRIKKEE